MTLRDFLKEAVVVVPLIMAGRLFHRRRAEDEDALLPVRAEDEDALLPVKMHVFGT